MKFFAEGGRQEMLLPESLKFLKIRENWFNSCTEEAPSTRNLYNYLINILKAIIDSNKS